MILKTSTSRLFLLSLLICCRAVSLFAAQDWPCFHGADRTNCSSDTGLLKRWPAKGPKLLWVASGLGVGYSSISIQDGRIYTAGSIDKQTAVFAIDSLGDIVWKTRNGRSWETDRPWARAYSGSRGTPTVSGEAVYHLGETGRLVKLDALTGQEIWVRNLIKDYEAPVPQYGYTESVVVEGNRLYCCPAGNRAFALCIEVNRGKTVWTTLGITGDAAYNSGRIDRICGIWQFVSMSSDAVFGIDVKNGKLLWKEEIANERENTIADPVVVKNYVFVSSGYGRGSMLLRGVCAESAMHVETVWDTSLMDNHHGGVVYLNGYLYGAGHKIKGWACLDFATGTQLWNAEGKGSLTYADSMLYCLDEKGFMKLVRAIPDSCEVRGTFKVPSGGKGLYWAHPVVCNGVLYVRHADKLFAYDVRKRGAEESEENP